MTKVLNWHDFFDYDFESGVLRWKIRPGVSSYVRCGDIAGSSDGSGYLWVKLKGKMYSVTRIIYEMFNGKIPRGARIGHRNGIISDNRIDNLRLMRRRLRSKRSLKTAEAHNWNEIFVYDSESGVLRWKISPSRRVHCGDIAGSRTGKGYLQFTFKGIKYRVHRIIYEMVHGKIPQEREIDHRNGVRSDNRIGNLRPATHPENAANSSLSRRNTSGYKGVFWCKEAGKWEVRMTVLTRRFHFGYFVNKADAIAARLAAEKLHHGEFARSLVKETA